MVARLRNYLLAGVLTVIPIWITWVVFEFVLRRLSSLGRPWVAALSRALDRYAPDLAEVILQPWFQSGLAVVITLLGLTVLGAVATMVIGKRILAAFDRLMERIPLVQTIYGASKTLLGALQQPPGHGERVVLISFPYAEMKAVGVVTRVFEDQDTGERLAAVYVPTTPNPTSGYLEIVPLSRLTPTAWTMDQAMTFVMSGGTVGPERIPYHHGTASAEADFPETDVGRGDTAPASPERR